MTEVDINGKPMEEPNKLNSFRKFALVSTLSCAAVLLVIAVSSPLSYNMKIISSTKLDGLGYIETKGRQPIKQGCVNLYGSDWAMYPNTRAVVICNEQVPGFMENQIDNIGFADDSENHGISYIETGNDASVTIYTANDYLGDSLLIGPNKKVWLEQVRINGGARLWNDKVMSVFFQGHQGALVSQLTHQKPSDLESCADHCAMLYATNPFTDLGPHDTTVIVICGDPTEQKVWKFSENFIQSYGFSLPLYSLGVSWIQTGAKVTLTMYQFGDFTGHSADMKAGKTLDLTTLPYPDDPSNAGWNDKPLSFVMTLTDA